MSYLTENWQAITVGAFFALMVLTFIFNWLRHRRVLKGLAAELMDERQGQGGGFSLGDTVVTGHYHGRPLKLSLREARSRSASQLPQLTFQLSCSVPPVFMLDRPRSVMGRLFGISPGMVTQTAGVPGSFGFLLEKSGVMPRRLFGIDMGGGTGLPLAPIGDQAFDESFCLSASEPARDEVLAWMRGPGVKEQVESLFSAERLALLTPTSTTNEEVFLAAAVRRYQETDLEPANVRSLLNQLEVIAKSLEAQ